MNLQIDIYQCSSKHIHVILEGQAEGMAAFADFDVFSRFIDACHEFISKHQQVPQAFLDAFKEES